MSKAILVFSDSGDEVTLDITMEGGFDIKSNAHQHANIVLNYLDSLSKEPLKIEAKTND